MAVKAQTHCGGGGCLCVHVCMQVYVWRSDVNTGYLPQPFCTYSFEMGSLTKPGAP